LTAKVKNEGGNAVFVALANIFPEIGEVCAKSENEEKERELGG